MKSLEIITLMAILITPFTHAASQVNYLNIDGDAVHFSLADNKTHTLPRCAVAETNQRYAFSLKTDAGRAMYSLIITAIANKQNLSVESANDCADVSGFERVGGLNISLDVSNTTGSKAYYLYQSDGVNKLGKIIGTQDGGNKIHYMSETDNTRFQFYVYLHSSSIYFSEKDCTGIPIFTVVNHISRNNYYQGGRYFKSLSYREEVSRKSRLESNGECTNASWGLGNYFKVEPHFDPLCGESACIIKEE
jgi:hypothetical protein